jgi:aarF domain-containing kinase
MARLFTARCNLHVPGGIDLDAVLKDVLRLARKHEVCIDSCYASLVITVLVLVGFATSLDPEVNLMDAATPTLLAYTLTGRVIGRLYT